MRNCFVNRTFRSVVVVRVNEGEGKEERKRERKWKERERESGKRGKDRGGKLVWWLYQARIPLFLSLLFSLSFIVSLPYLTNEAGEEEKAQKCMESNGKAIPIVTLLSLFSLSFFFLFLSFSFFLFLSHSE